MFREVTVLYQYRLGHDKGSKTEFDKYGAVGTWEESTADTDSSLQFDKYSGVVTGIVFICIIGLFIMSFSPVISAAVSGPTGNELPDGYDSVMSGAEIFKQSQDVDFDTYRAIYDDQFSVEYYITTSGETPEFSQGLLSPRPVNSELERGIQSIAVYGDNPLLKDPKRYQLERKDSDDIHPHYNYKNMTITIYGQLPSGSSTNKSNLFIYENTKNYHTISINNYANPEQDSVRLPFNNKYMDSNSRRQLPEFITNNDRFDPVVVESGYSPPSMSRATGDSQRFPGLYIATGTTTYHGESVIVYEGITDSVPRIADLRDPSNIYLNADAYQSDFSAIQTDRSQEIYVHAETGKILKRENNFGDIRNNFSVTPSRYDISRPKSLQGYPAHHSPTNGKLNINVKTPDGDWSDELGTSFAVGMDGPEIHRNYTIQYVEPNGTTYTASNIPAGSSMKVIATEDHGLVPEYKNTITSHLHVPIEQDYNWFTDQLGTEASDVTPQVVNPNGTLELYAGGAIVESHNISVLTENVSENINTQDEFADPVYTYDEIPDYNITTTDAKITVTVFGVIYEGEEIGVKYGDTIKTRSYSEIVQQIKQGELQGVTFEFERSSDQNVVYINIGRSVTTFDIDGAYPVIIY